eukprot:TRINITY_DN4851_c0_g1_i2.p1 TRINITY_DN4851_c0_g1~~TRINITY_DN4851_c0_g1_i2.p1  ORF type:complete len:574 (-),score=72.34 TRINITY_DN4851_c0_g1_i2:136-1857(-)
MSSFYKKVKSFHSSHRSESHRFHHHDNFINPNGLINAKEYHQQEDGFPKWKQYMKRSKREWKVIRSRMNWRFLPSIVGPLNKFLVPSDPLSEWALIRGYFRTLSMRKILKLLMLSVGSVVFPFIGVILLLFVRFTSVSVGNVGDEFTTNEDVYNFKPRYSSNLFVLPNDKLHPLSCLSENHQPPRRKSIADIPIEKFKQYLVKFEHRAVNSVAANGTRKTPLLEEEEKETIVTERTPLLSKSDSSVQTRRLSNPDFTSTFHDGHTHGNILQTPSPLSSPAFMGHADASNLATPISFEAETKPHSEDKERWIFVNGMCVDRDLLWTNALQLSRIFKRRVSMFHNPTQGMLCDLVECFLGRTYFGLIETTVARRLKDLLYMELFEHHHQKVVLCVHSQGSIIASNAIILLIKESLHEVAVAMLSKLEVYTFGCAADEFDTISDEFGNQYPYYEHFANKRDFVAQIGVGSWKLPGRIFTYDIEGHLFGEHYLSNVEKLHYTAEDGTNAIPRLYTYLPHVNITRSLDETVKISRSESPKTTIPTATPSNLESASTAADVLQALGGGKINSVKMEIGK